MTDLRIKSVMPVLVQGEGYGVRCRMADRSLDRWICDNNGARITSYTLAQALVCARNNTRAEDYAVIEEVRA